MSLCLISHLVLELLWKEIIINVLFYEQRRKRNFVSLNYGLYDNGNFTRVS